MSVWLALGRGRVFVNITIPTRRITSTMAVVHS